VIINGNIASIRFNGEEVAKEGFSPQDYMDMLGLLPFWAETYSPQPNLPLRRFMEAHYGFPMSYHSDGEVDAKDRYHYPGDPPLEPLYAITFTSGQRMIIYKYGLVSFLDVDDNQALSWFHSRMD